VEASSTSVDARRRKSRGPLQQPEPPAVDVHEHDDPQIDAFEVETVLDGVTELDLLKGLLGS
jgi:hypothetical protein